MTPQSAPFRSDQVGTSGQMIVRSDRLVLRPLRRSDMGLIEQYAGTRQVAEMTTSIPHPLPPGATDAFVTRCLKAAPDETVWALDAGSAGLGELVGLMSLDQMDRGQAEIGYWVAPVAWNTGLATEALRALMQANPMKNSHVFGKVFQDNPASARVLTNAGFDYIGDAEAYCIARGAIVPQWTYIRQMA
ncbi:GNAT family N-acetyltransferase [Jannaschia sp. 2305UL9-9]|uniref:GNAT family N-acetyltransferase n=1 Tax=Jannaschia sp. 2305UL9-9 TaxID=3121638 RepID=UPI00352896B6